MLVLYVHNDNFGGVSLDGGLNGRTVSLDDLVTFSLDLGSFGASQQLVLLATSIGNDE